MKLAAVRKPASGFKGLLRPPIAIANGVVGVGSRRPRSATPPVRAGANTALETRVPSGDVDLFSANSLARARSTVPAGVGRPLRDRSSALAGVRLVRQGLGSAEDFYESTQFRSAHPDTVSRGPGRSPSAKARRTSSAAEVMREERLSCPLRFQVAGDSKESRCVYLGHIAC